MRVARRLCGILVGAAGATGLVLCVAGIVGCWVVRADVVRRADQLLARTDSRIAEMQGNLDQVGARLRQTESELAAVQKREADLESSPPERRGAQRALSRKAVQALGPQLGDAHEMLVKANEIGLVANGLLDALAELPAVERVRIDTDGLKEASAHLSELTERTGKLASLLAREGPAKDDEVVRESSGAAGTLRRALALSDTASDRLKNGRQQVADAHARATWWVNVAAITVTLVLLWVAAGQASLLIHGGALARRARPDAHVPR